MKAKVGSKSIEIERVGQDRFLVDGYVYHVNAESLGDGLYLLMIDGSLHEVRVDGKGDKFKVHMDHEKIAVQFTGFPQKKSDKKTHFGKISDIKSPMPGLVVDVRVKLEQKVRKGDSLIVVETMKMENEFSSPIDGVVREISAKVGQDIKADQSLVMIESI